MSFLTSTVWWCGILSLVHCPFLPPPPTTSHFYLLPTACLLPACLPTAHFSLQQPSPPPAYCRFLPPTTMTADTPPPHVIVFPLPAQGHINPLVSIAGYLASSGISITLVHTTRSHSLLSHSNPPSAGGHPNFRIEVVPDALPSKQLTRDSMLASFPLMQKGLEELLEKLLKEEGHLQVPSCLIVDSFLPWAHEVAVKYGIPRVEVWPSSASVFSMGFHIPELIARGYLPIISGPGAGTEEKTIDFIPGLPSVRLADLPKVLAVDDLNDPMFQFFNSVFQHSKQADRILAHTVYELESFTVDALRNQAGISIDPVGPLIFSSSASAASLLSEDSACLEWLDQQETSSVLYISFGSIAAVEADVCRELAIGLEASGERFLWVIRPDAIKGNGVEDLLPEGFQLRTQGRGVIIPWAPQLAVLAHHAVGAFLTHCGWNSIMESLYSGVPMIGFPQAAEQHANLKYIVEDLKVGIALQQGKNEEKSNLCSMEMAVKAMMREKEGTEARRRALELRTVTREAVHGSSKANLERLVDDIKQGRLKAPRV